MASYGIRRPIVVDKFYNLSIYAMTSFVYFLIMSTLWYYDTKRSLYRLDLYFYFFYFFFLLRFWIPLWKTLSLLSKYLWLIVIWTIYKIYIINFTPLKMIKIHFFLVLYNTQSVGRLFFNVQKYITEQDFFLLSIKFASKFQRIVHTH